MLKSISHNTDLPETGFLRLPQIIGNKKEGIPPIIPVSKSTWWAGVNSGLFPEFFATGGRLFPVLPRTGFRLP